MDKRFQCKKYGVRLERPKCNETEVDCQAQEEASTSTSRIDYEELELELESLKEEIDFKELREEMDCIKERTNQLRDHLKVDTLDDCPDEKCVDFEVELNLSKNKDIASLQRTNFKLQTQVADLTKSCDSMTTSLKKLCQLDNDEDDVIDAHKKKVGELLSWQMHWNREFGLCKERFNYMKQALCEWDEMKKFFDSHKKKQEYLRQHLLQNETLEANKVEFLQDLGELNELLLDMYNKQAQCFVYLESIVGTGPLAPPTLM